MFTPCVDALVALVQISRMGHWYFPPLPYWTAHTLTAIHKVRKRGREREADRQSVCERERGRQRHTQTDGGREKERERMEECAS